MNVRRVLIASMLAAVAVGPLAAQGIPTGARISRTPTATTRIMVATPFVFASADSATAVAVGQAMRARMVRVAPRNQYTVISDSMMNAALEQFGYPPFSILNQQLARTLAQQIAGRVLVTSQMARDGDGRWNMVARLSGTNDDAGVTVRVAPAPQPADMGTAAVDALKPALETLEDARRCMSERVQKPQDARKAAQEALEELPSNGLAHFCLAQLATDTAQKVEHLRAAVAGDSLSLVAMRQLAAVYEVRGDTANTVAMLQHMLRAAPTDQELRTSAFRYFLSAGRSDAAIEVADEGLRRDPANWDLWDLKSNACLFAGNYGCAVEALEQAYAADSSRADTLFFAKIAASAEQRLSDTAPPVTAADTARYVRWASLGAQRFPNNVTLLGNVAKAYTYTNQVDSSAAVARRLLAVDSTNMTVALAAGQALMNAGRHEEALEFIDVVAASGDETAKTQAAGLLVNGAVPLLQGDTARFELASNLLRRSDSLAPAATFNATVNYLLGVSNLQYVGQLDPQAERGRSCELARQMSTLLAEAGPALDKGQAYRPEEATRLRQAVTQYATRASSMERAYCG